MERSRRFQIIAWIAVLAIILVCWASSQIGYRIKDARIKRVLESTTFEKLDDARDFLSEANIKWSGGKVGWKAHNKRWQKYVDIAHREYFRLFRIAEKEAESDERVQYARELLDDPPDNYATYAGGLEYCLEEIIGNEELREEINQELKRIEPKRERDQKKLDAEEARKQKKIEAERKEREAERQREKEIADIIGPKPENSSWDAAVAPVVSWLKSNLKDPKSLEFIEWSPVTKINLDGEYYWAVRVKYRAKNSFGGYVVEEIICYMRHEKVVFHSG